MRPKSRFLSTYLTDTGLLFTAWSQLQWPVGRDRGANKSRRGWAMSVAAAMLLSLRHPLEENNGFRDQPLQLAVVVHQEMIPTTLDEQCMNYLCFLSG